MEGDGKPRNIDYLEQPGKHWIRVCGYNVFAGDGAWPFRGYIHFRNIMFPHVVINSEDLLCALLGTRHRTGCSISLMRSHSFLWQGTSLYSWMRFCEDCKARIGVVSYKLVSLFEIIDVFH